MKIVIESILAFATVLGILVFIHEFGHFITARLLRIKVNTFSFGFGKRLFGFERNGTDYRVSLVPLGGYVKLAGENPEEHDPSNQSEFLSRPKFHRFLVIVMGALFNIALAIVLTTCIFMYGIEMPALPDGTPVVDTVKEGSPAHQAGIMSGDKILELDGKKIVSLSEFTQSIFLRPNSKARLLIERNGENLEKGIEVIENLGSKYREGYIGILYRVPYQVFAVRKNSPADKTGLRPQDRVIGINGEYIEDIQALISRIQESAGTPITLMVKRDESVLEMVVTPELKEGKGHIGADFRVVATTLFKKDLPAAFVESLKFAYKNSTLIFVTLRNLVRGYLSLRVFSGPIEIASIAGESYRQGPLYFIFFIAIVSLQLGIVNLLPIPVLDGGHIFILIVEAIVRRDLNAKMKEIIIQTGLIILLVFMGVIIYLDIIKALS